jgi:hypothetical protein
MSKLTLGETIPESVQELLEAANASGITCPLLEGVETGKGVSFYASAWYNKAWDTQLPQQFVPVKSRDYVPKPPVVHKKYQKLAEQVDWHLNALAQQQELITEELKWLTDQDTGYHELYARETQLQYLQKKGREYLDLCSFCTTRNVQWDESHPEWLSFIHYCDVTVPEFLKYKTSDSPVDPVAVELPPPPPTEPPPPRRHKQVQRPWRTVSQATVMSV